MHKLLFLANHFIDHGGGIERVAHDLARHLAKFDRFEVTLAAHGLPDQEWEYDTLPLRASTRAERMTGLPLLMPHASDLMKLANAVRDADCVLLHDNLYVAHLFAQLAGRFAGKPVLLVKHTGWIQGGSAFQNALQHIAQACVVRPSIRAAQRVVAVTSAKRDSMVMLLPKVRIDVVENGIDTGVFYPEERERDVDVLFVGRFVEKKGIGLIRELARRLPELRFLCVGFGPISPERWGLPQIEVISSPPPDRLPASYRRARLMVAPCLSEGTPLTIMESLACGTPVLASHEADHPDLPLGSTLAIDLDWPPEIVDAWAAAIRERLAAPFNAARLHESVRRGFSLEAVAYRYAEIVDDLVASRAE